MPLPHLAPAFADDVVSRLRHHLAQEQARRASTTEEADDDLDLLPEATSPAPLAGRHRTRKPHALRASAPDAPHPSVPPVSIPTGDLALALRLAGTFTSPAAVADILRPGALTCLTDFPAREAQAIARLLPICILPPATTVTDRPSLLAASQAKLLVLRPESDEDPVPDAPRNRFLRTISNALGTGGTTPILMLLPSGLRLPPAMATLLPQALRLAPLGRDLVLAQLQLHYAPITAHDTATIAAALPDDRALAGLPDIALPLALRAPDARTAAERLAALAVRHGSDAPGLDEIGGNGPALQAARRLIADLTLWRRGEIAWSELGHSMLLYGPPGTGKTWLARAMGRSAGIGFVGASFARWQAAGHLGHMLAAMQASFAEARRIRPALLFIDEIDAVGSRTDPDPHNGHYRHQVINAFLEELDAIARDEGVIVLGACNHPERIDPAVLRSGRFDLALEVPLPDAGMLHGILRRHLDIPEPDLRALADTALGLSAADLDAAIRLARSDARAQARAFGPADLRARLASLQPHCPAHDRRIALHECGHAIVAAALGRGRVTRLLLGRGGGEARRTAIPHDVLLEDLEREMAVLLAGRAAERLALGAVSAGAGGRASSDLGRATAIALSIDTTCGLGALGPVWYDTPAPVLLRDPATHHRVRARIEAAETRAGTILAQNRDLLEAMAGALVSARELDQEAAAEWLAGVASEIASVTGGKTLKE